MFNFGIEHEVAFIKGDRFADFSNTTFAEFEAVIHDLPVHPRDYPGLRVGDLGIKHKRWYTEGFERFNADGSFRTCVPKGIEIRTSIRPTIAEALAELHASFRALKDAAAHHGLVATCASLNPFQNQFIIDPPLNRFELTLADECYEITTGDTAMITYGPDFNLSFPDCSDTRLIDLGRKLTFYSPFIVPFSFSSPFRLGRLWEGYSFRTFYRTGRRPAAMVFLQDPALLIKSIPTLTNLRRIPAEAGRIEFKAFDTCRSLKLYAAFFALLKGLLLDPTLKGRALVPDVDLHQLSARHAFHHESIRATAHQVLTAAQAALASDPDQRYLDPLFELLAQRLTPAHALIAAYHQGHPILDLLQADLDW